MKCKRIMCSLLFAVLVTYLSSGCDSNRMPYKEAEALLNSGQYEESAVAFEALGNYKNAPALAEAAREKIRDANYNAAMAIMEQGDYAQAIKKFQDLGNYKDALEKIREANYNIALVFMEQGDYTQAIKKFQDLDDYKDAHLRIDEARELSLVGKIWGSWSLNSIKFLGSSDAGSADGGFSVDNKAQRDSKNIMLFDKSGNFHSGINHSNARIFAGESLNLTAYNRWKFTKENENSASIKGRMEFSPVTGKFSYTLSISEDNIMTITIKESYNIKSESVGGYRTKSGVIPMTFTLTLVRTPE